MENNKLQKAAKAGANTLPTPALDLFAPPDRFTATSRLFVRLHRHQLLLRKYWWALLLIFALSLGPLVLLTLETPQAYQSNARMWLMGKIELSSGQIYTEELVNFLGTQADLLRSEPIQQRALASAQSRLPDSAPFKPLPGMLDTLKGLLSAKARARIADDFPFKLKVAESSKSSLLDLYVQGAEPKSTRAFLNALMSEYLKFKRESREQASDRAVASLARQVNQLAAELKEQQERMYAFQMSNNVVLLQEEGSGSGSYLALLNRQLQTLRTESELLQMLQPEQWVQLSPSPGLGNLPDPPPPGEGSPQELMAGLSGPRGNLFRATQQIQLLTAKREELAKELRPMHPNILKLDGEIASQQQLLEVARNEIKTQLANRRDALQLEVKNLQRAFDEWENKTLQASRKMVDFDRLRQDVQRTQAAYDHLLSVISTVDLSKSVDQENVSVLESASAAGPVHRMVKSVGVGVVLAFLLSGGLFWLLGKFDDRFACSAELAEDLPERVLGQVMDIRLGKPERQLRPESLRTRRFEFLESFRSIRSALWFMGENGERPKTILIGSSVPQEGKSTVALYLAATMARAGSRVLLVDGDMRRAKLHRYFSVASSPGLADILSGEATPQQTVIGTSFPNLDFLPAGAPGVEPGELVLGAQLKTFLEQMAPHYDHVILDSPPVLAADDAAVLAPSVDGVLFVVRGAFTSARMVREALDTLRQRHARVLGLVFNRAVSSPFDYHSYQRYRNQYRWQEA